MTTQPVELDALLVARDRMVRELQQGLNADERRFLLSLVVAEPDWSLLGVPHLEQLPGPRWKLQNSERLAEDQCSKVQRAIGRPSCGCSGDYGLESSTGCQIRHVTIIEEGECEQNRETSLRKGELQRIHWHID